MVKQLPSQPHVFTSVGNLPNRPRSLPIATGSRLSWLVPSLLPKRRRQLATQADGVKAWGGWFVLSPGPLWTLLWNFLLLCQIQLISVGFCWLNFQSVESLPYFLLNSPVWWLTPLFFHHFWWWNHFQWLRHQGVHPSGGVFDVPTVPTVVPTVIPRRRPRCTSTFTAPCVSCCPRCCRDSMPRCSAMSPRCGGRCSARRRDAIY